jgi:hypothetical protein
MGVPNREALSIEISGLTLEVCRTRRLDDSIGYWAQAVVAMAGPAAEQRFADYPPDRLATMWGSAWKTDHANAYDWLRRMDSAVMGAGRSHSCAGQWAGFIQPAR